MVLLFSMPSSAATTAAISPEPGNYCPSRNILLISAEELSASLGLVMSSRAALVDKDQKTAISKLASAGTILRLAASRGVAARTILLIDAIIQSRTGGDYAQMLAWFPLLQTYLLTLPNETTVSTADDLIGRAEDIMQGEEGGDPLVLLKKARHMLACDGLDIPLQEAIQAQDNLMKQLDQNTKSGAYDTLLDSLRRALAYTVGNSEK
ncbi:hypothetical protein SAMN05428978_100818 [Nitrosomonas sp. Nm34]|nr:hypothetical protein SAMN05428978_100818 [Nitrosomonas sp. Nm34]